MTSSRPLLRKIGDKKETDKVGSSKYFRLRSSHQTQKVVKTVEPRKWALGITITQEKVR